jgi:hypothetical protein
MKSDLGAPESSSLRRLMNTEDDAIYYAERERVERCLAANATDEAAKAIHITMAAEYRRRAVAARPWKVRDPYAVF